MSRRMLTIGAAAASIALGCAPSSVPPAEPPAPRPRADTRGAVRADAALRASTPRGTIGPDDRLEVVVFEAPELNRMVRVASTGMISLPLLGEVRAAGLTPRELELGLESQLRARYIRDPHVGVQVAEMRSHSVAVVGAVAKSGVFQLGEPRPLLEVVALAGGFSADAGESVIVSRGGASTIDADGSRAADDAARAASAIEIRLDDLLESGDLRHNILVHPGDLVSVRPAGLVYVLGEVRRPGAFPLERRTGLTVLQAIALGEGLAPRAAGGRAMLIRTNEAGERVEIRVNLDDVIAGRAANPKLQARDVVFVPNSTVKSVSLGAVDAMVRMVTLRGVF